MTTRWSKLIRALHQKKNRQEEGLFLVEGSKSVEEALHSPFQVEAVFFTERHEARFGPLPKGVEAQRTNAEALEKVGTLQSNDGAIAVVRCQPNTPPTWPSEGYLLALDDVRDPGNLGAIIRIADWYGLKGLVCSENTADFYNPKVIASSMGSFTRVIPYYCELGAWLQEAGNKGFAVFGALMEGENIHRIQFPSKGILLMGNEANGIQQSTMPFVQRPITIPRMGGAESLNVAIATAICCDNIMRG